MIKLCFHFIAVALYCIVVASSALAGSALAAESSPAAASGTTPKATPGATPKTTPEAAPAGVGLLLTLDKPAHFVVQYVLPGMPAANANVQVGDVVLAVDGAAVDNVRTVEELVDKIRGVSGSTVKLKIQSGDKTREIALVRGAIPTVKPQATDDFGRDVSVYFYQYQDLIPDQPGQYGFLGNHSVAEFLRKQLTRRGAHEYRSFD